MPRVNIPTIAECEQVILAEEGPFHVLGTYYGTRGDADIQRRRAAIRMVADAERRARKIEQAA